jgi:hypothetical protein
MPRRDPVVEEVHAARDAIAKASDNDIDRIVAAARKRQGEGERRVVRLPPRRLSADKKA